MIIIKVYRYHVAGQIAHCSDIFLNILFRKQNQISMVSSENWVDAYSHLLGLHRNINCSNKFEGISLFLKNLLFSFLVEKSYKYYV